VDLCVVSMHGHVYMHPCLNLFTYMCPRVHVCLYIQTHMLSVSLCVCVCVSVCTSVGV
jgi:hypothetical protein